MVGPGLGRAGEFFEKYSRFLAESVSNKVIVFDADSLYFLTYYTGDGYGLTDFLEKLDNNGNHVILTPNQIEAARLLAKLQCINDDKQEMNVDPKFLGKVFNKATEIYNARDSKEDLFIDIKQEEIVSLPEFERMALFTDLTKKNKNLKILLKGRTDLILSDGMIRLSGVKGSPKRCGGQGDILAGLISVYCYSSMRKEQDVLSGVTLASILCRILGSKAFAKYGFGLSGDLMLGELVDLTREISESVYSDLIWEQE